VTLDRSRSVTSYDEFSGPKELVRAGYDAIGPGYAAWAATVRSPVARYLDELDARLADGSRVLDLGCGPGVPAARLAARHRLTCVDFSAAQLELARGAVPDATFVEADMTALELPARSFDAAIALYSILHVPPDEQPPLLRRIAGWLEPGGLFLATLGVGHSPAVLDPDWLGAPMFSSSLGAQAYLELFPESGFEVLASNLETQPEHQVTVAFLWMLAGRRWEPSFRPLVEADLPLLREWLRRDHVRRWFDGPETYEDVERYYLGDRSIDVLVVELDGRPVGLVQTYLVADHPDYAALTGLGEGVAGIDLFIAEEPLLGRGLGADVIRSFVRDVVFARDGVTRCSADPDVRNRASIRAFARVGFRASREFVDPKDGATYRLMLLDRG